jgi:hypothetical protein
MRPSCRTLLNIRVAVFAILIGFFSGVAPRVGHAQTPSALPKSWNDAMAKLGDEVAAVMSPTSVAVNVQNISSLDASYAAAIGTALRGQLQHHSFALSAANSAAAQPAVPLLLTLSESVGEYLWVIQIPGDATDAKPSTTMIVSVSKSNFSEATRDQQSLSLEKRFVWQQPERFIDFALLKSAPPGESTLLVLESKRVAVYKSSGGAWQLSRSTPILQAATPSRDPEGSIDAKTGKISLKGLECAGEPDLAGVLQCKPSKPNPQLGTRAKIPGLTNGVGALVHGECGGDAISLYTGEGDWTQTDSIQGYLINLSPISAVAVGDSLQTDGPVTSLQAEPDVSAVRAVVRNLKTGEYEAYIVTATCDN